MRLLYNVSVIVTLRRVISRHPFRGTIESCARHFNLKEIARACRGKNEGYAERYARMSARIACTREEKGRKKMSQKGKLSIPCALTIQLVRPGRGC